MSTNTTVICDGCGKNIQITTHYEREAYLELRNVLKLVPRNIAKHSVF